MADSTSPLLQLLLMETGLHNNDWGTQNNANLVRLENAVSGTNTTNANGGTVTLTDDQARAGIQIITGNLASNLIIVVPSRARIWWVRCLVTFGGFTVSVRTSGGTIFPILTGDTWLYCDGTQFSSIAPGMSGFGQGLCQKVDAPSVRTYLGLSGTFADLSASNTFTAAQNISAAGPILSLNCTVDTVSQIVFKSAGTIRGYIGSTAAFPHVISNAAAATIFTTDASGNSISTGNITAFSDARLKTDVETIDYALDLIDRMRGVRYTRIDSGTRRVGVIAQEVQDVVPEVVLPGYDGMLSVSYGDLVGVLIQAVKELKARVEALEAP